MLVSIIIPCYNSESTISAAVDSALAQIYSSKEVIVIDDGSTDASLDVIRSFGDRIRWETGPNRGACAARNRGIALARGELIQFLDGDDSLHPEKLSRMVPIALAHGPGTLVACDWERRDVGSSDAQRQSLRYDGEDEVVWMLKNQLQTAAPVHWHSDLTKLGGFDESLPCAQERDLHLRLACHGTKLVHVPEVLVQVRRQAGSLSSDSIRVYRQHLAIVNHADVILRQLGRSTDERRAALAGLLARDARVFLRAGLAEDASRYFDQARRLHRQGGWDRAYTPGQRRVARLIGPGLFERLVVLKRRLREGMVRGQSI